MFSKSFITLEIKLLWVIVFCILCTPKAYAYRSEGVERINPNLVMKQADKEGLVISAHERAVKKDLAKLKRTNSKEFDKKLGQGLENSSQFQGYLLEIKEGLQNVEKAKKIAKIQLFKKVQSDWNIIKTSALNTRVDSSFASYKSKLKADLDGLYYLKFEEGYVFQVGQWGYVTVSKSLKNVNWRVEFNSKYDKNQLEEGAEDIQIQEDDGASMEGSDMEPAPEEVETPPKAKSQDQFN